MTRTLPALTLVALTLSFAACSRKSAPAETGVALVHVAGGVTRAAAGGQPAPVRGGALAVGDYLVTGDDGGAVVRLPDGRELELGPRARLRVVAAGAGAIQVKLESGAIVARLGEQPAGESLAVSVLTPFGVTRLPAGAGQATVDVGAGGASITVALGSVEFVDQAGKVSGAVAGQSLKVTLGGVQIITTGEGAPGEETMAAKPTIAGKAIEIKLTADRGQLLLRPPGSGGFSRQRAVTAAPGTAYRVSGRDGRARLEAGQLQAQLGPGASGRVGEAHHVDNGDHLELGLDTGSALVQLSGGPGDELRLPLGKDAATVRPQGDAVVKLVRSGRRPALTAVVLLGELEIEAGGQRRRLVAGDAVELTTRGIASVRPPTVPVTLPTARGLRVHADALEQVTLSWPAELADAHVEVANDPQFQDLVLSGRPGRASVDVPAPRRGDLHWRIKGERQGTATTLLGSARFLPDRGRSALDLANPHNLVTETGEVTTVYFQSVLPALTFSFTGQPGARRHRVRIYRAEAMNRAIVERDVTGTQCALEAGTLREGRYLWHAVAVDPQGRESTGGLMNKLDLVYDNALNTLAIGSPKPGASVSGPDVQVSGIAPIGSKLYVNGQPAPLDEKGRFDMRVLRTPAVIFRLLENDGTQRYWVRALRWRS
jgi:hypothetical protein